MTFKILVTVDWASDLFTRRYTDKQPIFLEKNAPQRDTSFIKINDF